MSQFGRKYAAWILGPALLAFAVWLFIMGFQIRSTGSSNNGSLAKQWSEPQVLDPGWPQFRGPTYDSISTETGLADSWPEAGPPVVWTRELGQGYSSFAAMGRRVYTQTQSIYEQSVVCLDADTGGTIWSYSYGWPFDGGGLYPGPRSTPTWSRKHVYFAAPDGLIGCLDADNGKLRWSCNPKKSHRGRGTDFGYASSPVVVDDRIIVPVGGLDGSSVVALDARDGSTLWTAGDSSASYATPLPVSWKGRSLAVIPLENSIAAFDLVAGKRLWEIEFSEGYDEHSAAPLYKEPYLLMASPFRAGSKCFRLVDQSEAASRIIDPNTPSTDEAKADSIEPASTPLKHRHIQNAPQQITADDQIPTEPASVFQQTAKPVVQWDVPHFSNDVSSSVLFNGRVYGFDLKDPQSRMNRPSKGEFRCLDFESGRIIWSTKQVGQASPIIADGKLILFTDSGELVLARCDTDAYVELARTQVFRDEICWTSPALHHGRIYLRTQTRVACLDIRTNSDESPRPSRTVKDIPRGRTIDAKWLIGGEREFPATVPQWDEFNIWYEWSLVGMLFAAVASLLSYFAIANLRDLWVKHSHNHRTATMTDDRNELPHRAGSSFEGTSERTTSTNFARAMFWMASLIVGTIGSPLVNSIQSEYVLLWPFALWTVFQLTINVITVAERHVDRNRMRWLSRICGLLFIGTSVVYFSLCRGLGYAIEWSFLVGFLPSFVVAMWAARYLTTQRRYWLTTDLIFSALSFTAYFWFSVMFIKWRLVIGS